MRRPRFQERLISGFLLSVLSFSFDSHVDEAASVFAFSEHNNTVNKSVKSVIFTHTYVFTRMVNGTALTLDDVACFSMLTTENLNTKSFAF